MDKQAAQELILKHFPNLEIGKLRKIGEGTGNVAFEVNRDLIFRFPKKPENQKQLEQEILIQGILEQYSTLPFPKFIYLPQDHSFVGYKKLVGKPMLYVRDEFKGLRNLTGQLGEFLGKLHQIPTNKLNEIKIVEERKSFADWNKLGQDFFEKTQNVIPKKYFDNIKVFFNTGYPESTTDQVFCHNDLGIEHILVIEDKISGIIDWGGVAITDPACDFARIYRDLGPDVLDGLIREYTNMYINKEELRKRAIFYGKNLFFEDLFYGTKQPKYLKKSLDTLRWMF